MLGEPFEVAPPPVTVTVIVVVGPTAEWSAWRSEASIVCWPGDKLSTCAVFPYTIWYEPAVAARAVEAQVDVIVAGARIAEGLVRGQVHGERLAHLRAVGGCGDRERVTAATGGGSGRTVRARSGEDSLSAITAGRTIRRAMRCRMAGSFRRLDYRGSTDGRRSPAHDQAG